MPPAPATRPNPASLRVRNGELQGHREKDLVKMSDSPDILTETAVALVFSSFLCTPHSRGGWVVPQELDLGHISSTSSLTNGRVSGQQISKDSTSLPLGDPCAHRGAS